MRSRVLALCLAAIAVAVGGGQVASAAPTDLFFSEYVEGTSNNKALEVYNGTGTSIDLASNQYIVQMYFNGSATVGLTIGLQGSVAPGDTYVLTNILANAQLQALADQISTQTSWYNGDDAVVLRKGGAGGQIVDAIGQIGFDPGTEWGTGLTSTQDNTLRRKAGIEAGDTIGDDAFDPSVQWDGFATDTFDGLGTHTTGGDAAPQVASSTPANNAVDVPEASNVDVVFTEPVNTSAAAFAISCTSTGAHAFAFSGSGASYSLDPAADFARDERCTVTIDADGVTDADADDPPNAMAADATIAFSTLGLPATIMQIQGAQHTSPLVGRRVAQVPGVVTAVRPSSFYIQDPSGDGNLSTSDGILVFGLNTSSLSVGQAVLVNGTVTEFGSGDNLTVTELTQPVVTPAGPSAPIAATILGEGGRTQPTVVIENDASGDLNAPGAGGNVFDIGQDGIDFYESLENMLVQVNNAAVVNATRSFGEITLLADAGANATGLRTARGGILLAPTDANPERITVDDEILRDKISPRPAKAMPDMNVGARITSPIVGPLDYSFENYKIQAMTQPVFVESPIQREVAAVAHPSDLTIATFNVENLAANNAQSKFDELAGMIVNNLRAPDILGIEEIQDDNGTTNNGNVSSAATWAKLLDAIEAAGGPTYDFRQIDPVNNADGGAPGGNIRVGLLFRTDLEDLRFVDRPGGTSTNDTSVVGPKNHPRLTLSPGRLGTGSPAFADTRKPLVGEFVWKDRTVFVVVNHFSSKGDDQGIFSRWQPPTNFSEGPRHGQAQVVNDFVDAVLAIDKDANVVVVGDINDFEFSKTVEILEGGGELTTLMKILPPTERYSYVFEGNSQVLDQILVSPAILKRSPAYDPVHVNSEFADARQASDHDPQVAYLRPKGTGEDD